MQGNQINFHIKILLYRPTNVLCVFFAPLETIVAGNSSYTLYLCALADDYVVIIVLSNQLCLGGYLLWLV